MVMASPAAAQSADKISNQYICTFARSMPGADVRNEAAKAAGPVLGQVLFTYEHAIKGFAVHTAALSNGRSAVAEMKRANPKIAGCEQDQVMKIVARPGGGGGGGAEQTPPGITAVGGSVDMSGSTKTAFVIDSGIDLTHPDLNVDTARSKSFVGGDAGDKNGHGTHVSGTIGAKKNGVGVVGVAAGIRLVAVRVLGANGSGSTSGVIAGIDYVKSIGKSGDVANMSLGGGFSQALNDAVVGASASVKFALAAGNESDDANNHSPASANGNNIYTVSAVDSSKKFASFSNFGNPPVDYAEPGVSILSTYKGGGYATLSGTSMASPHMAGLLLVGGLKSCGTATSDPDGNSDPFGCH
ncbi:S8 family serine peptidase [Sphingomonas daechungensis]|uniref:S8 family serine peptidase n=1 Tax=Sphingomonas daechungensis TaxID=1176646 RepID=UPI0037846B0B